MAYGFGLEPVVKLVTPPPPLELLDVALARKAFASAVNIGSVRFRFYQGSRESLISYVRRE